MLGGVWKPIVKWRTHVFTIFTPFFTLGPGSTTLYSTLSVSHGLISSTTFLQHSTTLYNTLQSTALQHFYSLQPLQHPSASFTSFSFGFALTLDHGMALSPSPSIGPWVRAGDDNPICSRSDKGLPPPDRPSVARSAHHGLGQYTSQSPNRYQRSQY